MAKENEVAVPHADSRFPLKQKAELLREELQQAIRDMEFLHGCTGSEYANRRKHELALRLEEIDNL